MELEWVRWWIPDWVDAHCDWRISLGPRPDGFEMCGAESSEFVECEPEGAMCYARVGHEHPHIVGYIGHPDWLTDVVVQVERSPRTKAAAREER